MRMRKFTFRSVAALAVLLLGAMQAHAIITDPDDYIIYDTGALGDSAVAAAFDFDAPGVVRYFRTERVKIDNCGAFGRGMSGAQNLIDLGYPTGVRTNSNPIYGIAIKQDLTNETGTYKLDAVGYKQLQRKHDPVLTDYRWDYNKPEGNYYRPSDSLIVRVPATCDSVVFMAGGINSTSGVIIYQKDQGRNAFRYMGGNWGQGLARIGFNPKDVEGVDSVDYVIFGAEKDWYGKAGGTEWKDNNSIKWSLVTGDPTTQHGLGTDYCQSERWGVLKFTNILRIKVYGKIEKGEIPPFTGTISGWTFQYRPKTTGTVDLDNVISTTSGWGSQTYGKYASDEGVVRSMLTASKNYNVGYDEDLQTFGSRLTALPATSDTTDFTQNAQHPDAYYQIAFSSKNFQDMTLNFDFAIRGGADSIVAVAKELSSSNWIVLGKVANSENPVTTLAHASLSIPNDLANKSDVVIRLLQNGGNYVDGAELDIARLRIDGYDDYVSLNDGAQKVAYITSAVDRLHILSRSTTADSTDYVYRALRDNKDINVKPITADIWTEWTVDNIAEAVKDYSVVIMSPYIAADASIVTALGSLVGQKPILTLNADAYAKWNTAASVASIDTYTLTADNGMRLHPIFKDIAIEDADDGFALPKILSGAEDSVLQAISVPESANGYVLGGAEGKACFYEDFAAPKYKIVYLGIKPDQAKYVNSTANKLIAQALKYLTTGAAFAAPTFEIDKDGNAIVENVTELKDALVYDFSPLALSQSTILLKEGEYAIDGAEFGSGTFVLQPYQSGNVKLSGNMTPTQKVNVKSVTFKDLTLEGSAGKPFISLIAEKSNLSLTLDGCTVNTMGSLLIADADSAKIPSVTIKNSHLNNVGPSFVSLGNKPMSAAKITMSENVIDGISGPDFIEWSGEVYPDGEKAVSIDLSHNTVISSSPIANIIDMKGTVTYDSIHVALSNNLFYNALTGKGLTLASDSLIRFKTEGNLFYNSEFTPDLKADSLRVTRDDNTMEALGLTSIFESEDSKTISKMSPLFTAGTSRTYIGALATYANRTEPGVFAVHNVTELTDAMNIAIGGDVIEFYDQVPANETDTLKYGEYGVYYLGTTGLTYPTTGGDLTLRAAEGQHPVLFGRIAPSNAAKLDALRIVGLKFADQADYPNYDKDAAGPFYFSTAAQIGVFHVTQCTFENLQNQQIMRANNCSGMFLGDVRFDYNVFENHGGTMEDGNVGAAHFFQFSDKADYTLDHFTFVENIVSNFHGSQLFNINRSGSKGDSAIVINISNNLFYKLGGNAKDQKRNFMEFNKAPQGCTVDIQIANNLFYKRWSDVYNPICQLALYDPEGVVSSNIVVTNNYFEGEYYGADSESYGANPVSNSTGEDAVLQNLAQTSGEVEVTRGEPLTWEVLGVDEVFTDEATFTISQSSPLYTAGVKGACIGPKICYGIKEALNSAEMANEGLQAFSRDGRIYVNAARNTELRIYSLTGKMVRSQMLVEGINEVDGLAAGLYIVRVNNAAVKVLVR